MIKILLVEDEPPISRAIKSMIEQIAPELAVVHCEYNGQSALDYLQRESVDAVLTDIRMPVMDGLKLVEALRERYPDCLVAILSGYQDFSYAQTALRFGVIDYLLKPVSREDLAELLDKLEDICSVNALNERRRLVMQSMNGAQVRKPGDHSKFSVMLACVGAWPLSPDDSLTPGTAFWEGFSTDGLCKPLLAEGESLLQFDGKVKPERAFVFENVAPERFALLARTLFDKLCELAAPAPVTVCAFSELAEIGDIGAIIRALRANLYSNIRLCSSQLFWDSGGDRKTAASQLSLPVGGIVELLVTKNAQLLKRHISEAVTSAVEARMTQMEFCRFLDAVICDQRLQGPSMTDMKLDLNEAVSNAVTPQSLADDLFAILDHFNATEFKAEHREVIGEIEQYLERNFNKNITSEMLSRQFGFVPSYISKIFRRHKGVSPSEYLTRLRIEKAKATIVSQPALLIREVAQLVGYNDPYYFSKAFKKVTGQWPTQYQAKQTDEK